MNVPSVLLVFILGSFYLDNYLKACYLPERLKLPQSSFHFPQLQSTCIKKKKKKIYDILPKLYAVCKKIFKS